MKCTILVMSYLGPSLSDLFYQQGKKFSLKTTLMLGIQMLSRLERLHRAGIVHRDIKPGNFVMGPKGSASSSVVYLIDFGLAHHYRDSDNRHMEYRDHVAFRGTHRYASITSHFRVEQTRRDDLEALGYVLIYFLQGGLPWQNLQVQRSERREMIGNMKKKVGTKELTEGLPVEFETYLDYTKALDYAEDPDYAYMTSLFENCLKLHGYEHDYVYDWCTDEIIVLAEEVKYETHNITVNINNITNNTNNNNIPTTINNDNDNNNDDPYHPLVISISDNSEPTKRGVKRKATPAKNDDEENEEKEENHSNNNDNNNNDDNDNNDNNDNDDNDNNNTKNVVVSPPRKKRRRVDLAIENMPVLIPERGEPPIGTRIARLRKNRGCKPRDKM